MASAVVFGFAVADGLEPVAGAAPWDVLARQLPRQLVACLNGGADRGVRFFPFLGVIGQQRSFLRLREPLAPEVLSSLHRQGDVALLVDGAIQPGALRLRLLAADARRTILDTEIAFDPTRPMDVLPRAQFEVMGALGWTGRPAAAPDRSGAALAWHLVARDWLLALEAGLAIDVAGPIRAVRGCIEHGTDHDDVRTTVVELARLLLRQSPSSGAELAPLLAALSDRATTDGDLQQRLGVLLQSCGAEAAAATAWARAAAIEPGAAVIVARAVGMLFAQQRPAEARDVLAGVLRHSPSDPTLWFDHARACTCLGDEVGAAASLRAAVAGGLAGDARCEADRLLKWFAVPGLWTAMRRAEADWQRGAGLSVLATARAQVRRSPGSANTWLWLGIVHQRLHRTCRAARALRLALRLDPHLGEAHNRLGILLVGLGDVADGHGHLRLALQLLPQDPSVRLHLAQACALLGRPEEGIQHLQAAEQSGANPATVIAIRERFFAAG